MPEVQIPVTIGHWLVALLPLVMILFLLVGLRWETSGTSSRVRGPARLADGLRRSPARTR